jgi:hypothetical protein
VVYRLGRGPSRTKTAGTEAGQTLRHAAVGAGRQLASGHERDTSLTAAPATKSTAGWSSERHGRPTIRPALATPRQAGRTWSFSARLAGSLAQRSDFWKSSVCETFARSRGSSPLNAVRLRRLGWANEQCGDDGSPPQKTSSSPLAAVCGTGCHTGRFQACQQHGGSWPGRACGSDVVPHRQRQQSRARALLRRRRERHAPMGNQERMLLVSGTMLPGPPAQPVITTGTCVVYRDPALKKLIGEEYGAATTNTGDSGAQMEAESSPGCP